MQKKEQLLLLCKIRNMMPTPHNFPRASKNEAFNISANMKFAVSVVSVCLGGFLTRCSASESTSQLRRGDVGRDLAEYDCSVGCPAGNNGNPVCAEGITFQHECYAYCQGMTSIQPGSCSGASDVGFFSGPGSRLLSTSNPGIVTTSQMNMYAEDGFLFVGNVEIDEDSRPSPLGPFDNPPLDENGSPIGSDEDFGVEPHTAIRVTYEGLGYISTVFYPDDLASDSDSQNQTGKKGGKSRNRAKKGAGKNGASKDNAPKVTRGKKGKESNALQEVTFDGGDFDLNEESIIGQDTRSEVPNTRRSPNNKICEIDYGSGEGGCTGVVVGRDSIITAAHCVYNRSKRRWHPVRKTAPGRYRDDGKSREPYGTWEALDATLYGRWANDGKITHDVAVVRFKKSSRYGRIGDRVGRVQLVDNNCRLNVIREGHITGYPADKPNGEQTTSNRCDDWRHSCDDLRVYHQCDTKGGNSGSPMLDKNQRSFGVHTHGGGSWNSGVMLTQTHLNVLRNWID